MSKRIAAIILVLVITLLHSTATADGIVVAFEKKEYSILVGKTETIKPVIQGTKATGKFTYFSSNDSIATVNNGQVKGISSGDATITCIVAIGSDEFSCSFVIHVMQPVTKIEVPIKNMTLPAGAILNELPFIVYPDDAANKEIDVFLDNKKIDQFVQQYVTDGSFPVGDGKGTHKYSFKTTDGSNISAQFTVTVPSGAWFSIDTPITIDNPMGIDFFYVPTLDHGSMIITVDQINTNKEIYRVSSSKISRDEFLKDMPFSFHPKGMTFDFLNTVHLEPLKVGKGQFVVKSNNDKALLDVTVTRSAVYESIQYDQFQKNEAKNQSLRFSVSGTIASIEKPLFGMFSSTDSAKPICIYVFYDGDELRPVCIQIPNNESPFSLITGATPNEDLDISSLMIGDSVSIRGVFIGMTDYLTETGLTKSIPCFTAERIEQDESHQG